MKDNCLKVKMFGTFAMEYDGNVITIERNNTTKTNQLMQLLVYNRNGISREQLIQNLFPQEEVADLSNSLRALVFRLRKSLKAQAIPGNNYIRIQHGIYSLEPEIHVECDVHQFEKLVMLAKEESDRKKRYKYLKECCQLYVGEFLPMLSTLEWVIILNVKYKNLYFYAVENLCNEYIRRNEYKEMLLVAGKAAALYPFDGWQSYQMEALIALNQPKDAIQLYEETEKMLFEELGVTLPKRMTEQFDKLGKRVRNNTDLISDVKKNLEADVIEKKAFFCSYPHFAEIYRYVKRTIERSGQSAWLLLCTIVDGKGYSLESGERLQVLSQEIEQAIAISVRRGDMYTRYSHNQYLILLMDLKKEDCDMVIERINANMKKNHKNYLQYTVASVSAVKGRAETLQFDIQEAARQNDEY